MKASYTIALAGNPNCGKTTLFNALTGSNQHVGNYPGVTVEKKEGILSINKNKIKIIDLPGMYDLKAHSPEEEVAREVLENSSPDLIVSIVDSSSIERNLFLTSQLMELGVPILVVLNMTDAAEKKGISIKPENLSKAMNVSIVKTIGHKCKGVDTLKSTIFSICEKHNKGLDELNIAKKEQKDISPAKRYAIIKEWISQSVVFEKTEKISFSEKLDSVLTHSFWGVIIFLGLMYIVFTLVFVFGAPFMNWIEYFFAWLSGVILSVWPVSFSPLLKSLIIDGVIGGVGGVIVFLPNILLLFLAIAFLEGTGYMSRVAYVMDRFMNKINLHGKSIVPMLLGFGCSVPAIMATRTLESKQERLTTMMVVPLMSCGARLTIYALIIPAFFPTNLQGPMLLIMYVIGILVAVVAAKILRKTIFKGDSVPFIIELPDYRVPTIKSLFIEMWNQGKEYLKKAGTLILAISIILWVLISFPKIQNYSQNYSNKIQTIQSSTLEQSIKSVQIQDLNKQKQEEILSNTYAGRMGKWIEPAIKPLGFDWKIGTALIGALTAKEMFVAQLGIVNSVGEADENSIPLRDKLKEQYSGLVAFCIMLFCLISSPCVATFAVTKRESNSWVFASVQFFGLTVIAYLITFIVYQVGSVL
ncbi:MAG: ferrous iron transport protein B [Caldisericia bacterium]|nr:ferrous iron transport protein B [Caldisericia bacterium]